SCSRIVFHDVSMWFQPQYGSDLPSFGIVSQPRSSAASRCRAISDRPNLASCWAIFSARAFPPLLTRLGVELECPETILCSFKSTEPRLFPLACGSFMSLAITAPFFSVGVCTAGCNNFPFRSIGLGLGAMLRSVLLFLQGAKDTFEG